MIPDDISQPGYLLLPDLRELLPKVINPYEERLLAGIHYQIRIGQVAWIPATTPQARKKQLTARRPLSIAPGREAIIRSNESFALPNNILGILDPDETYAIKGIMLFARRYVETGIGQHIFFTLSNISDDAVEVELGDPIANMYFVRLSGEVETNGAATSSQDPPVLPRILEREIETHPELAAKVRLLESNMAAALRSDYILLDRDLGATGPDFIDPFESEYLFPDGYSLRVGQRSEIFFLQHDGRGAADGRISKYISAGNPLKIPPGHTALVRTMEQLKLPPNISVTLTPLGDLSRRYLNYDGRVLSPGYQGFVWFNLHNYGTDTIDLEYGEAIVHARFIKLGKEANHPIGYGLQPREHLVHDLPPDEVPQPPTIEWTDLLLLSNRVDKLESDVAGYGPTKQIIELVFMATVAGILAGFLLLVLPSKLKDIASLSGVDSSVIFGIIVVGVVVYLYIYLQARRRRR